MTVVNTHEALCLLGVRTSSAMQMQTDAMTVVIRVRNMQYDFVGDATMITHY